jgi:hypothetical protein
MTTGPKPGPAAKPGGPTAAGKSWIPILAQWKKSGLGVRQFCRRRSWPSFRQGWTQVMKVFPKSPMGQPIRDSLGPWTALGRLLGDGEVPLDMSAIERPVIPWFYPDPGRLDGIAPRLE